MQRKKNEPKGRLESPLKKFTINTVESTTDTLERNARDINNFHLIDLFSFLSYCTLCYNYKYIEGRMKHSFDKDCTKVWHISYVDVQKVMKKSVFNLCNYDAPK